MKSKVKIASIFLENDCFSRQPIHQVGQTLILFLGFVAALVSVFLMTFNAGQMANAKMRAMNAADAAAYSGAVWQARTLNFQAYMNRAMVANEVAIAQSVSLRSWVSYVDSFINNGPTALLKLVPYLGDAVQEIGNVIQSIDQATQSALPVAERALRGINQIYFPAQEAMHLSGTLVAQDLAKNVAQQNGAQLSQAAVPLFAKNSLAWMRLTQSYRGTQGGKVGSDRRTRLREVTLLSRDGFSYERDWNIGLPIIFNFQKQGGTDLINFDTWKGLDSSHFQTILVWISWFFPIPMGWGGAQGYSPKRIIQNGVHGQYGHWNSIDGRLAKKIANDQNSKNIGVGFPNYRDIQNPQTKNLDLHIPFVVEVVIPKDQIKIDSENQGKVVLPDTTVVDFDSNFAGNNHGVFALAEACIRFVRPYDNDRSNEYPSLFSPYWHASLATNSASSRAIVDALKGLAPVVVTIDGNGTCS